MTAPDQATMDSIAKAVGYFAINHARVEDRIDAIVAAVKLRVPGGQQLWKRYPVHSESELSFLEEAFRELLPLELYRQRANALCARIQEFSPLRNAVIHGCLKHFDESTQTLLFTRVVVAADKKGGHREVTIKLPALVLSYEELENVYCLADALFKDLSKDFEALTA